MRFRRTSAGGAALVSLVLAACSSGGHTAHRTAASSAVPGATTTSTSAVGHVPRVTRRIVQKDNPSPAYTETVSVAQVDGMADAAAQAKVNAALQADVDNAIHDFEQSAGDPTAPPPPAGSQLSIQGDYEVTLLTARLLSLRETISTYLGGAHGSDVATSFTFDLASGRVLALRDLFRPGADYLRVLADESTRQLKANGQGFDPSDPAAQTGLAPKDENFAAFNLAPDRLEIVFQEYQVGPYALGLPKVRVAASKLRDLLAPDLGWP